MNALKTAALMASLFRFSIFDFWCWMMSLNNDSPILSPVVMG